MRPIIKPLFLLLAILAIHFQAKAQTCSGSLGDPIISQTFGSGANPGAPLGASTTYLYSDTQCPNDGSYTVANSTSGCFGSVWHTLTQDHTGNPNGYMMLVNASVAPGIFYTQTASAGELCPNTTYEFAAYILNLIKKSACGGATIQPNITFNIKTKDGVILKQYNTGDIPATDAPVWDKKYGTYFTTPAEPVDVIVEMVNNAPGGCGNDIALDDITFRACGPVVQAGFGDLSSTGAQDICQGTSASYTLTSSVGAGYTNPFLQWQLNYNNTGWTNITGQTSTVLNLKFASSVVPGSYQYRLAVGEGQNIASPSCNVSSSPLTINVNPLPIVTLPTVQTVCEGNTLTLTASGGASYQWSGPGIASSSQNPLVINNATPATAGIYSVIATSDKGCVAAAVKTTVNVEPIVVAVVSTDVSICAGESTRLSASGSLYYKWTPSTGLDHDDIPNPVATPAQTTTYTVKVSNDGCYDDTKSVTVTVLNNPIANAGSNKTIFEGQSVKLDGTVQGDKINSIYWTPSTGLDDPASTTPNASPVQNTTYTLTAVSESCGTSTSSVFVRVYEKITIPNTFTPNGDQINDYWVIKKLITYPECKLMVYTRYGHKVYESNGYATPWDGTINGTALPQGTYYYVLDLKNGTPKIAGWVLIVK